ncbi:hypothetical protein V8C42DRAFT_221140 [Trichoderma barbatum]
MIGVLLQGSKVHFRKGMASLSQMLFVYHFPKTAVFLGLDGSDATLYIFSDFSSPGCHIDYLLKGVIQLEINVSLSCLKGTESSSPLTDSTPTSMDSMDCGNTQLSHHKIQYRALVPFDEWIRAIEASAIGATAEDAEKNPGIKLIDIYEGIDEQRRTGIGHVFFFLTSRGLWHTVRP